MSFVRHLIVRGRVQGVGFRMWIEDLAERLGLEGWVRNRRDGSVEAVFGGPEATVADMIAVCRRGPPGAYVEAVDEREGSAGDLACRRAGERFSVVSTV